MPIQIVLAVMSVLLTTYGEHASTSHSLMHKIDGSRNSIDMQVASEWGNRIAPDE